MSMNKAIYVDICTSTFGKDKSKNNICTAKSQKSQHDYERRIEKEAMKTLRYVNNSELA